MIVNDGHECLVAVANHPGDPLPAPLPDAFDPPTYRQVAQRNLSVLSGQFRATTIALTVAAVARADKAVAVTADVGGKLDERTLATLGLADLRPAQERLVEVGLQRQEPRADEDEPAGDRWVSGTPRIVASGDDRPAPSVPRRHADGMTVADVPDAWSFTDSGPRRFFRVVDGLVERRAGPDQDWHRLVPLRREDSTGISYHRSRHGDPEEPVFDMIAANSGRLFAKERGRTRFWFAMLEPMFRRAPNVPVRSAYFKLDPEQGSPDARIDDRLGHLAGETSSHPAAVRFPIFRKMLDSPLGDSMAVNVDRYLGVWHLLDARPPSGSGNPPRGRYYPPTVQVVTYQSDGIIAASTVRRRGGYDIRRVLDIGVGHEHWHEHDSTVYGGELDSLDGPGLPPVLRERDVYRFFNGPVDDKGGFIDGTVNYYALCQFLPDEDLPRTGPPPRTSSGSFGSTSRRCSVSVGGCCTPATRGSALPGTDPVGHSAVPAPGRPLLHVAVRPVEVLVPGAGPELRPSQPDGGVSPGGPGDWRRPDVRSGGDLFDPFRLRDLRPDLAVAVFTGSDRRAGRQAGRRRPRARRSGSCSARHPRGHDCAPAPADRRPCLGVVPEVPPCRPGHAPRW